MFRKLLIANRGEIACRIVRTAHRLGVAAAVVYSQADEHARHVRLADEAWPIGPAPARESYLDARAVLDAARRSGADAIHPGYGFLSESEDFAAACAAAGFAWVGPPPAAIAAMGEKAAAKERMRRAGVPVLPGYQGEDQSLETLERRGRELGFPLIIKPSAGGGGKGMHIIQAAGELRAALEAARRIAASAFGDERLLLERYLPSARHVEVQVLADAHGRTLHLLDRDCSVQRRHQKLIEEAPAPGLSPELRQAMAEAACAAAREVGYVGAGTVEMLVESGGFYFMEMNTRLQVEHPVTEAVTGLDLVEWQLRIAAGERLTLAQSDIAARGHAIEARVCAEDPVQGFLPGAGVLRLACWPAGDTGSRGDAREGIRVDHGFDTGDGVPPHYDSLLGKIVAHAASRDLAIAQLHAALSATRIAGVPTNIEWLADALRSPAFQHGPVDTSFVARHGGGLGAPADTRTFARFAAAARVFALRRALDHASPWALGDGFRLSGVEPIEIAVTRGDEVLAVRVWVMGGSAVRVGLAGSRRSGTAEAAKPRSRESIETRAGRKAESDTAEVIELVLMRCPRDRGLMDSAGGGGVERAADAEHLELRSPLGGATAYALVCGDRIDIWREGRHAELRIRDEATALGAARHPVGGLTATLPGVVVSVHAAAGQRVVAGDALVVVEAMKMEHTIQAPRDGVIAAVHVRAGGRVREGDTLVTMTGGGRAGGP